MSKCVRVTASSVIASIDIYKALKIKIYLKI